MWAQIGGGASMESVGIRELKERTSEILRLVREQKQEVAITYRGKVVARIVPVRQKRSKDRDKEIWHDLRRLREEISAAWPEGVSAVEAVREQRGEL
jgi:prevent-host-death family protein